MLYDTSTVYAFVILRVERDIARDLTCYMILRCAFVILRVLRKNARDRACRTTQLIGR